MPSLPPVCLSCDTFVALGPATAAGITLFAKNSDRPSGEAQPLRQIAAREHDPGATVRTQYLEIPQVERTASMIGSQPHWLWGFEHGVNEYRVAIGNETVFTKETLGEVGLLGMDLVRLGLERARTAREAVEVMTGLLEEHGQGGSAYDYMDFRYNNSFLISDPREAWILETSSRRWAARLANEVDSISNQLCISDDWDRLSDGMERFARERGWDGGDGRFNFQAAYRDTEFVPPVISEGRLRRSRELLATNRSRVTPEWMRTMLRDHYDGCLFYRGGPPDRETTYSLCMHSEAAGTTNASIIAELPTDPERIPVCWTSMATPCTAAFMPLFIDGSVPEELGRAGEKPGADSPWWRFKRLSEACAQDFETLTPKVQAIFQEWEEATDTAVDAVRAEAQSLRAIGSEQELHDLLTSFMRETYDSLQCRYAQAAEALGL